MKSQKLLRLRERLARLRAQWNKFNDNLELWWESQCRADYE